MKSIVTTMMVLFLLSIAMAGNITTVEIVGASVIELNDTLSAREDALADAFHKAVRQAVANLLPPALISEKSLIIEDKIFSHPGGYIMNLEVTGEGISADSPNTYKVTIKAGVLTDNIQKTLALMGISPQKKGYPRLLVLVDEQNIDDKYWHRQSGKMNGAEVKIRDVLWGLGFPFIDQMTFIKGLSDNREKVIYDGDIDTLINLGRINDAQVILYGKAQALSVKDREISGEMAAIEARISLKAVRADDGQTISAISTKASQRHVDAIVGGALCISQASEEAANTIARDILNNWSTNQQSGIRITLVVNGLQSAADVQNFKAEFQGRIKGVNSLERRTYSGTTAAFDLVAAYSCDDIIDQISTQGLNSYTVRVRSKSQNYLELNLKAK